MLKGALIHPEILASLAGAGHGARILVADANYPFSTGANRAAKVVFLNLAPGIVDVPTVVELIHEAVPLEAATFNVPDDGSESEVIGMVRRIVGSLPEQKLRRFEFYEAARDEQVCLVVATGETRIYSCVLLTIGYIA